MEITLDAIISLLGLFVGGGGGAFFTWRYLRRKAKAEAVTAEIDATKDMQDMYQQMLEDAKKDREDRREQVEELRKDRDHYKQGYVEFRDQLDKLTKEFRDFRNQTEDERATMKRDIARNGRQLECMRPFLCGRENCAIRIPVTISATGELEKTVRPERKDIEPLKMEDL